MAKKKDKGWIKLHRKITNNFLWTSREAFDRRSAWIDLLLMANHESRTLILRNGVEITIEAGQMFTSYDSLADRWHWSRNRVRRYLDQLSAHQMVTRTGTPSGTLITVNSWALYQFGGTPTNKPTDLRTGKQTDLRTDHEQEYIRTINNKNVKEEKAPPFDSSEDRKYE